MGEVLEILKGIPVGGISFASLVAYFILQIFQGNIIPGKQYERLEAGWKNTIDQLKEDNGMLKEAYRISEAARESGAEDIKQLLVLAQTTVHLLESVKERAEEARP